jgi:hypothetical protein
MFAVCIVQGIESNVRHHRRFIPLMWGEQRQNDYFKDFPHGGRLDMRFTRANNVNGTLYSDAGYTVDSNVIPVQHQGIPAPWSFPVPMQHYSHMLNYDYFKVNQPYVRHPCAPDSIHNASFGYIHTVDTTLIVFHAGCVCSCCHDNRHHAAANMFACADMPAGRNPSCWCLISIPNQFPDCSRVNA